MAEDDQKLAEWDPRQSAGRAHERDLQEDATADRPQPDGDRAFGVHLHSVGVERAASMSSNETAGAESEGSLLRSSHVRTELIPWDDPGFVREFEQAREQVLREGLVIYGPKAAARLEQLMRSGGYSQVAVDVERTVDEALHHSARWTVRRDGRDRAGSR